MISRDALLKPVGERVAREVQRMLSKWIGKSLTGVLHTQNDSKQKINKQNSLHVSIFNMECKCDVLLLILYMHKQH